MRGTTGGASASAWAILAAVALTGAPRALHALDNGRGITPPRGWRSWDAFENSVTQALQQEQVGHPPSLAGWAHVHKHRGAQRGDERADGRRGGGEVWP